MKSRKPMIRIYPSFVKHTIYRQDIQCSEKLSSDDDDVKFMNIDNKKVEIKEKRKENLFGKLLNIFIHQIPKV